ncbi:hypothetical protein UFOVP628_30 [uncultured Caudovirales phage]|uniref:Uncharacterized protein n=1 Tax=uncultured Caudovirales phage TaxID=2100421 RepID=A0A6J5NED2_9CAUD|nr:hypothetical protein UFOVP628_30 [uncultured Caudovirales phage]
MATLPQFKQRQIARRSTSDIDRLAKQYKSSVDALTGEYQTAFTGYQAGVTEKMKPFEAQMATYKESLLPTYEAQKTEYQKKLDDYNKLLADIEANPVIEATGVKETKVPRWGLFGLAGYETKRENFTYYVPKEIPKFTETAPAPPETPTAPTIEEFDSSQFAAKKTEAESTFKREVGERKAAKLGAVSRKATRPLLSGAQS